MDNLRYCSDTGKTSIYYATLLLTALAICIEYDKLLEFGIFELT